MTHPELALDKPQASSRSLMLGILAAIVVVLIWSVWIVTTRQAATVHIPAVWLGMIRFAIPAVLLAPFWWRVGLLPRGVDPRLIGLMVLGAGAPFFVLVATGLHYASAADGGVLLGGTMPFFAALLTRLIDRERFGASRILGFVLIIGAMIAIGGGALVEGHGPGRLLVVLGAALWAGYTLAFHKSGIEAVASAGIVAAWSTILLLPFALFAGTSGLLAASPAVLAGEVLTQGILTGVVALVCYGAAVRVLGASRAALLAAVPPALAAILAIPMLGEVPSAVTVAGVVLAVAGVALATGALRLPLRRR
jgi:drug/metabolite transporter (DMT)-like permease